MSAVPGAECEPLAGRLRTRYLSPSMFGELRRGLPSLELARLRCGLAVLASVFGAGCTEPGVLELFPGPDSEDCADITSLGAAGADNSGDCFSHHSVLVHRYSFNTLGTIVDDTVGTTHGSAVNTEVTSSGKLDLAGADSDQYVNLPNGLLQDLKDATFEAWVNWNGGGVWQRIFDFGNSYEGEDLQGGGSTYLFLTPKHTYGSLWLAYSLDGAARETVVDAGVQLPAGATSHVAAVVDDTNDTLSLYLDGSLKASVPFQGELAAIDDVNNWLGRSQFIADREFGGTFYEFRIYAAALTEAQLTVSYAAGPDPVSLEP